MKTFYQALFLLLSITTSAQNNTSAELLYNEALTLPEDDTHRAKLFVKAADMYALSGHANLSIAARSQALLTYAILEDGSFYETAGPALSTILRTYNNLNHPSSFEIYRALDIFDGISSETKESKVENEIRRKGFLALALLIDGNTAEALRYAEEAIEIATIEELKNYHRLDRSYLTIAYSDLTGKGLSYGQKVIDSTHDVQLILTILGVHIQLYSRNNQFTEAAVALERLKQTIDDNPKHADHIVAYYRFASKYEEENKNIVKAVLLMEKAIELNKVHKSYEGSRKWELHIGLGNYLSRSGSYNRAITEIETAVDTFLRYNTDTCRLGIIYHNLANVYYDSEDYIRAAELYLYEVELDRTHCNNPEFSVEYLKAGKSLYYANQPAEAAVMLDSSLYYSRAREDDYLIAYATELKSKIFTDLQDYERAITYAQSVVVSNFSGFDSTNPKNNPPYIKLDNYEDMGSALQNKARVYLKKWQNEIKPLPDDLKFSIETSALARRYYNTAREDFAGFETSKEIYRNDLSTLYDQIFVALFEQYKSTGTREDLTAIFDENEKRRAAILSESLPSVFALLPEKQIAIESQLSQNRSRYENKIFELKNDKSSTDLLLYQDSLLDVTEAYVTFIADMTHQFPEFAKWRSDDRKISLNKAEQNIGKNHLMLVYTHIADDLYIFTLSTSGSDCIRIKVKEDFDEKIQVLHKMLSNPLLAARKKEQSAFYAKSHALYQTLIIPIADQLTNNTTLTVIPEGNLFYLPFDVLLSQPVASGKPAYMISNFEINYHYSVSAYLNAHEQTDFADNSLLTFAPIFEKKASFAQVDASLNFLKDTLHRGVNGDHFTPLPATADEVNGIAELLNNNNINSLQGVTATKQNLIDALSANSYRFVHLATHGLVNYDNPALSGLACYEDEGNNISSKLLFANEIKTTNLRADLTVLSSCESGIGKQVDGEGLLALNRAFLYAGSNNVLFSLWKVNDRYTKDLMLYFYEDVLQNDTTYSTALRRAKLRMIEKPGTASPRFWAPFVLMGQ